MKKFLLSLMLLSALGLLIGCGGGESARTVTLASFESYDEVLVHAMSERFGRMLLERTPEFVTEGAASLKIQPKGDYENGVQPAFTIRTDNEFFAASDFSEMSQVSFDIYNAAETAKTVKLNITGRDSGVEYELPSMTVSLNPQQWSVVTYDLSDGAIQRGNPGVQDITKMVVTFVDSLAPPEEQADVFYLDNVRGTYGDIRTFAPAREADEILYFENLGDLRTLGVRGEVTLHNETSPLKVGQGSISLGATGSGEVIVYAGDLMTEEQKRKDSLAFDLMNDSVSGGLYTVTIAFNDEQSGFVTMGETVFAAPYTWQTYRADTSLFPGGKTLADVAYMSISLPDSATYIDAVRVV